MGKSQAPVWTDIKKEFDTFCHDYGRQGSLAAVSLAGVRWIPPQEAYLRDKTQVLGVKWKDIVAVSLAMAYHPGEIEAIPGHWVARPPEGSRWNEYAHAYTLLNNALDRVAKALAGRFGGIHEGATLEGFVSQASHVRDYFPHSASHRSVAEAAGLGWRGRHRLIVTPQWGAAFRMATLYLPGMMEVESRQAGECGDCTACLSACPILDKYVGEEDQDVYRERCRQRIDALGLDDEVCGICVRSCWEAVTRP
ncbi:MAG: hypothetical protein AB1576_11665 [Bacillota bacterium]